MRDDAALCRLAKAHGVLASYRDMQGRERTASPDTLRALLAALSVTAENARLVRESLEALRADRRARRFPAEVIIESGKETTLALGSLDSWQLRRDEAREVLASGRAADAIALPALASDVYALEVGHSAARETIRVIAAPACTPSVPDQAKLSRIWGVNLALYGLRSSRNAGLGDYADLADAARVAGQHGADFAGSNPLHAMGHSSKAFSPYSPSHRGFLNTGHIALDAIPGLENVPVADRILSAEETGMEQLRSAQHVDHDRQRTLHQRLLAALYDAFQAFGAAWAHASLSSFAKERGSDLARFARFEALACRHGPDWREWPRMAGATPDDDATDYHVWLQWVADCQLGSAQRMARGSGMALGLYLDLAVGARRDGAESWCERDAIARGVSIGAPPDHLNPRGQNWNISAYSPRGLAAQGYRPFRRLLAATMRHAGIVRIDHALGLSRSFWVPDDGSPGGYVRLPFDALLAILKIEAERHGTVVVGEDLGLAPRGFRKTMRSHGIYGYSVMQYERDRNRRLKPARRASKQALACFSTHDTPTVRGFETGRDIDWWQRLGWIDKRETDRARAERGRDVADLLEQCPKDGFNATVHTLLARSPSTMVTAQLDDILGHAEAQNLPGTTDEHVNWRRRYGVAIEELAKDGRFLALGKMMNEDRGKTGRSARGDDT